MSRRPPEPYETYPPEDRRPYSSSRSGSSYVPPRRPSSDWHRDSYYDDRSRYDRDEYRDDYARDEYNREWSRRERERNPYDDRYRSHASGYERGNYERGDYRRYSEYRATEPRRSRSPYHQRRESPSYTGRAPQPVSPLHERREEVPRRTSSYYHETQRYRQDPYAISRDEGIPTGPRSFGTGAAPPTGPKAYMGRRAPPTGPGAADFSQKYSDSPKAYPGEESRRASNEVASFDRKISNSDTQMRRIPSTDTSEKAAAQSNGDQYAKKDGREKGNMISDSWSASSVDVTEGKSESSRVAPLPTVVAESVSRVDSLTNIADKLGNLTGQDFPHHACPDLEAEVFNTSTARLRKDSTFYASSQYVAYRQALVGLSDSDIELVGARTRSKVTIEALQKAKEDAEAWSLESARIEASEKNIDSTSFFNIQHTSTVR